MHSLGADPAGNTPEFARFIRSDQAKWANLMRRTGIKPEGD
jgi:hypothetical protein